MMNYETLLSQLTPQQKVRLSTLAKQYYKTRLREQKTALWTPEKYQRELSESPAVVRGVIGGNRTGKTEWGAREAYYYLMGTHPYRTVGIPNQVWIGTPSFDTQVESAQPKLLKFLKPENISRIEYYQGNKIKTIYLTNGSKVTFKSYEQGKEKWAGAEKRLIWFDEEPPHDIWTESVVRHGAGVPLDIIFTLTPINGMTWLYDDIWLQAEAKGIVIKTPSWEDNTHITPEQIEQMVTMLSPEELEVRRFGKFVRRVGLVCPWWRRDMHLEDLSNFSPQGLTVWVGIDFGFATAHTAALFVALKGDDIYVYDGIYEMQLTTPQLAQKLEEHLSDTYITGWVADSASADDIEELKRYGYTQLKGVTKESGTKDNWDDYRARKMAEIGVINQFTGQPRLHVAKHLITQIDGRMINWFAHEIENLRWKTVRTATGEKAQAQWGDNPKDAIDALSYIICSLPRQVNVKYVNVWDKKKDIPHEHLFDQDGFYL